MKWLVDLRDYSFSALSLLTAICVFLGAASKVADAAPLQWVDTGQLTVDGVVGVEIRFLTGSLISADDAPDVLKQLCDTFAPLGVPFIVEKFGPFEPKFVSISVKTEERRFFLLKTGTFWNAKFDWENDHCGDEIKIP